MPSQTSGSLTATGSVALAKPATDTISLVQISGTYSSVTFVLETSVDGTNFGAASAVDVSTGLTVTGTLSPADNATGMWLLSTPLMGQVRARVTAIGSGTATFFIESAALVGVPLVTVNQSGATISGGTTFGANVTLSEAINFILGTTTGTKIGTATTQKLGFFNATPVVQPANSVDYVTMLTSLGLRASGGTAAATFPGVVNGVGFANTGTDTEAIGGSTAAAGSTNADAAGLPAATAGIYPTTGADGTKGVIIDVTDKVTGRCIFVGNGVSNQILKVYPPSGGTINGAGANAAFSSASGKGVFICCLSSGGNTWLAS